MTVGCAGLPREGWDGLGQNQVTVYYKFENLSHDKQIIVQKALNHWKTYIDIVFIESTQKPNWIFKQSKIDGPYHQHGNTLFILKRAYIIFDKDEPWEEYPKEAFYYLVLHEIGHALGLDHSNDKNSIMFVNPFLNLENPMNHLSEIDIKNIQSIYKPQK